jgi:predicted MPP superfamily phosphohydrolase
VKWYTFVFAMAVQFAMIAAAHYYLWTRVIREPALPMGLHRAATLALIVLWFTLPLAVGFGHFTKVKLAMPVVWTGFIWLGIFGYTLLLVLTVDGLKLLAWALMRGQEELADPQRRLFFHRAFAVGVGTTVALAGAAALRSGLAFPVVKRVKVALPRLPREMNGHRMVQISDLHVGPTIGRTFVERLVEKVNALQPDVVVLTGDIVDGAVDLRRHDLEPIGKIEARFGTFFVTGNHEYLSGAEHWIDEMTGLGVKTLRNERVAIGEGDVSYELAGVDDPSGRRILEGHGTDVARACEGCDPNRELILLAHQPSAIKEAAQYKVGLQLSGHTHGGQMWPFGYVVRLVFRYVQGLHRHNDTTQIYVSCGTGHFGPPMRMAAQSEITCLELFRDDDAVVKS